MTAADFERFAHNSPDLERVLGRTAYLDLLGTDFADQRSVALARDSLATQLAVVDPQVCDCASLRNDVRLPMGYDTGVEWFSKHFVVLARQSPWLEHVRCTSCGTHWYVGSDTVDDDYYFHRMTDEDVTAVAAGRWPTTFDSLAAVWPDKEWLALHGYASLEDWRQENGGA